MERRLAAVFAAGVVSCRRGPWHLFDNVERDALALPGAVRVDSNQRN